MTHTSIAPQPHSPSLTFMHRCSHLALSPAPSHSPLTRLRIATNQAIVCMHQCSHIACFMYACIGVRTLHCSCLHAYVFAHCMFHVCMHRCSHVAYNMGANSPYTHSNILKAVWERARIQYGSELAKQPLKMTWIRFCLFVLFAGLFV